MFVQGQTFSSSCPLPLFLGFVGAQHCCALVKSIRPSYSQNQLTYTGRATKP
jgi:hypothetical protein